MSEEKVAKLAYWLCECGKETVQPTGPGVKMTTHCPDCKKEHLKMREPSGDITEFVNAPDWFNQEWIDHMKKIQQRDTEFRQAAFQETEFHEKKVEAQKLLKQADKHSGNIIDSGLRRLKLHKRKDMEWMYNPGLKKFMGRIKPVVNPGVKL